MKKQLKTNKQIDNDYPWLCRDIKIEDLPKIYNLLQLPFGKESIQKGTLYGGREVSGIRMQYIIDRLNTTLGMNHWNYETDSEIKEKGRVFVSICKIKLSIGNWKEFSDEIEVKDKDENITTKTTRSRVFVPLVMHSHYGGCMNVSEYEAKKGSLTNAFKKCASIYSIGKEIWRGELDEDFIEKPKKQEKSPALEVPKKEEDKKIASEILTAINSVKDAASLSEAKKVLSQNKDKLKDTEFANFFKLLSEVEGKVKTEEGKNGKV